MIPSALLLLLGCPYIFGGPDLSKVDKGRAPDTGPVVDTAPTEVPTADTSTTEVPDSGLTGDTGLSTAPTGDTGPAPTGDTGVGVAPTITGAEVLYRYDGLGVSVVTSDLDGDLEGGTLTVVDDGVVHTFLIPDELSYWDPKKGDARVRFRPDDYCDGIDRQLSVTVDDARGLTSAQAVLGVEVFGVGKLVETGVYTTPVGQIEVPAVFCGEATDDYDIDAVDIRMPSPAEYTFTLGWDGSADLDFSVYEGYDYKGGAFAFSDVPPETADILMQTGVGYTVEVSWYWGNVVDWTLLIDSP